MGGSALLNNVVVVRALGPSLSQAGVTNALSDPVLELHDASGALIATNDDWQYSQSDVITATGLAPSNPKESAIYAALPDGSYTVAGRVKDMLISGSENIYPAEIENLLLSHPAVADCAVVGLPDAQWGEAVVACAVRAAGSSLATEALHAKLQELLGTQLAHYKQPRRWVWLPELPKTALGKVQKDKLRAGLVGKG